MRGACPGGLAPEPERRNRDADAPIGPVRVAMVSDTFFGPDAGARLGERLREARARGADLALLPEIALCPWSPATKTPRPEDAEPPDGPRQRLLQAAARAAGVAVLGSAIVLDAEGRRKNLSLLVDAGGQVLLRYEKLHLPEEPGFWETSHYEPGSAPPEVAELRGFPLGVQVCSDINRPQVALALAAAGAEAILHPRATERDTFDAWRLVLSAVALTGSCYVLSVNRPAPEGGTPLGGPSIAVGPDGEVLAEGTDPVIVVALEREAVRRARVDYPGYLAQRPALYARAWSAAEGRRASPA